MKLFLIATMCSGKSTFISYYNGRYADFKLFDIDGLYKENGVLALESVPNNSCVLGTLCRPFDYDIEKLNFEFIGVIIDYNKFVRNIENRKKRYGNFPDMTCSLPHLIHDNICGRLAVEKFCTNKNIPIYSDFDDAINSLYYFNY